MPQSLGQGSCAVCRSQVRLLYSPPQRWGWRGLSCERTHSQQTSSSFPTHPTNVNRFGGVCSPRPQGVVPRSGAIALMQSLPCSSFKACHSSPATRRLCADPLCKETVHNQGNGPVIRAGPLNDP